MSIAASIPIHAEEAPTASWIAIGSLAVGAFALVTSEFLPVGLLPAIARDMGSTDGQTGLMVMLPGIVAAITAPLVIHYGGHLERKRLLLWLLGLLVVSNITVALSTDFLLILVGRALLGVAIGGFWTIAGALGPRLRPGPDGVRAAAVILGGVSLGTVAGLPAGSLLGELFGWRCAFGASALFSALAMIALLGLLPRVPAEVSTGLRDMAALLRQRPALMSLIAASVMYTGTYGAYTYIAPFLSERAGVSGGLLSAVLLASGLAGFIGNMAGGWIAGRSPYKSVLTTAALAAVAILTLPLLGGSPVIAIGLVTLWGFSIGMQAISLQSWLQGNAPGRRDAMQGLFVSLTQAAIGLGAPVGGIVVDHAGADGAMVLGGVASLATLAIGNRRDARHPLSRGAVQDDHRKTVWHAKR